VKSLIRDTDILTPSQACRLAREAESVWEFEEARILLSPYFERIGKWPQTEGLTGEERAEIYLRSAVVSSYIGHEKQITDAQPFARKLLSAARELFTERNKQAECWNYEGVTCWRESDYDRAAPFFAYALSLCEKPDTETIVRCNQALTESYRGNPRYALWLYSNFLPLVESASETRKGLYFNGRAMAHKRLADSEQSEGSYRLAIDDYLRGSIHCENAGCLKGKAIAECNLGQIYLLIKEYTEAHDHLMRARGLFESMKDFGTMAQVDETRSRLLLAAGRRAEAEKLIRSVIRTLETGDEKGLLAEAYATAAMIFR
jgi:tetratricopeptide (TPR) repeat protein